MRRRVVIAGLLSAVFAPSIASGQAPQRPARLAFLTSGANESRPEFQVFRARLRELGWVEGSNLMLTFHLARGSGTERLAPLAREIAESGADVVLADGRVATLAMAAASQTIPIVSIMGLDPTTLGLAASLARPGGNVTGITIYSESLNPKRLEFLRELAPSARRIGVVFASSDDAAQRTVLEAGATLGFDMRRLFIDSLAKVAHVLAPSVLSEIDAVLVSSDALLDASPQPVVAQINAARKPAIYPSRAYADVGGLASYGVDLAGAFQRLAGYVDRVLRGQNPAEMPIERYERLELVINLRIARDLALSLPDAFFARADEVIE